MIVVTGAAGFIGSALVARLNELGRFDLIVVDHYGPAQDSKKRNLAGKKYQRFYDKAEFLKLIRRDQLDFDVEQILHMGACSSTTLQDADYFQKNNYEYSVQTAEWALKRQARLIYASSAATYGAGEQGYSDEHDKIPALRPLNLYGESKQKFDLWVLERGLQTQVVGLKFFNVYGPNEYHKEDMRSVVAKSYERVVSDGKIRLFKSYNPKYKDGEQQRDFIYVKDAVEVVLFFMDHPDQSGIFNVGTGQARTWNDLAVALFAGVGQTPKISYMDMPESLRARYQYYTRADVAKLRRAGYQKPFTTLEVGIRDYCSYLKNKSVW